MNAFALRSIVLFLVCSSAFGASEPPATSTLDGMILRVSGNCSVTSDKVASPAHSGDLLRTGDQLACETGNLFFHMGCTDQLLSSKSAPVTVTWAKGNVPCNEKAMRTVYESYATAAVGQKGGGFFISPASEVPVASSLLVLRWHPEKGKRLRFEIREPTAKSTLWKSDAVDGDSGALESESLREALTAARAPDSSKSLELRAVGAGAARVAHFQLISSQEEQQLKTDLAVVGAFGGNEFFRLIARAATLKRHGLIADAAQAFDAALVIAPQSPTLRERALEMNELIGNHQRVSELTAAAH